MSPGDRPATDTEVHLRGALQGDTTSLGWLVERFWEPLVAYAWLRMSPRLRVHHDPEGAVTEAWWRFITWAKGREVPIDRHWLRAQIHLLVTRVLVDWARRRGGPEDGNAVPLAPDGDGPDPDLSATIASVSSRLRARDAARALAAFLDSLDDVERTLLADIVLEGRKPADVAAKLGMTEEAVRRRKNRLLERLRAAPPPLLRVLQEEYELA